MGSGGVWVQAEAAMLCQVALQGGRPGGVPEPPCCVLLGFGSRQPRLWLAVLLLTPMWLLCAQQVKKIPSAKEKVLLPTVVLLLFLALPLLLKLEEAGSLVCEHAPS